MPQPASQPCSPLNRCRQEVATIEQTLDTVPGQQFTIVILQSYVNSLIAVITSLRAASDGEVRRCLRSGDREAVLNNIREARDALQLALKPLTKGGEHNKTNQYYTNLRKARTKLAEALSAW